MGRLQWRKHRKARSGLGNSSVARNGLRSRRLLQTPILIGGERGGSAIRDEKVKRAIAALGRYRHWDKEVYF
ncbi:hypothetical protein [Armatimonas sp.]|uniref:hypothetical protein n=1 Tax=Armatimonas sp. TaxID=1872638 RepID=UPI003751317A